MADKMAPPRRESFIFTDAISGREVLRLTNSSEQRSVHGYYDLPPWSPTSGSIAFSRMASPDAKVGDICVMDADGDNLTTVAHSRAMSPNGGALAQWSADGHRVYFRDRDESFSLIAFYDVEMSKHGAYPGDLRMICPTGNRQAYHTRCSDYPDDEVVSQRKEHGVFIQNLDTGRSRRIATVYDCWQMHPRRDEIANWHLYIKHTKWSPDGTHLMFVFTNEIRYAPKYNENPRVKDIYVVNPDGKELRRVSEFGNHPLWHPNSREILTNSHFPGRPGNSLVLTDMETGKHRLATDCVAGTGHPSFSPDGKFIAIERVSAKDGRGEIHLVDVGANSSECLVQMRVMNHTHSGTHLHPVWSWDGKQILYASDASGRAQLCVINV